jgi:biopolymer transport protein ExbB
MSLLEILARGGWMMWPIYVAFLAILALSLERYLTHRKIGSAQPSELLESAAVSIRAGDSEAAGALAAELSPALRRLVIIALQLRGRERESRRDRLLVAGQEHLHDLEQNLAILGTLAAISPLLGFLGTVTGMIRAFMSVQAQGASVTPAVLAGGIWEALVTTGAGLAVGIVALVLHNLLAAHVDHEAMHVGRSAELLLEATEVSPC